MTQVCHFIYILLDLIQNKLEPSDENKICKIKSQIKGHLLVYFELSVDQATVLSSGSSFGLKFICSLYVSIDSLGSYLQTNDAGEN